MRQADKAAVFDKVMDLAAKGYCVAFGQQLRSTAISISMDAGRLVNTKAIPNIEIEHARCNLMVMAMNDMERELSLHDEPTTD